MGEGSQSLRGQGRLIRAQESAPFRLSIAYERRSDLPIRRPRESGDPAAFVQKTVDSRLRGNDDTKVRGALTPPRPPCKAKPRGDERDTAQRRHRPEPARTRQREHVKAA